MKHFNPIKSALLLAAILFSFFSSFAQLTNCNAFMQGTSIEIGVNWNGAFGSSVAPPAAGYCDSPYHPRGASSVSNSLTCGGGCPPFGAGLGFVADPDKDGWYIHNSTTPWGYIGDYFLPGTPQEGWAVEADGSQGWAYNGGGCGTTPGIIYNITNASNISYSTSGRFITAVWQGLFDSMRITQTTLMDTSKVFFTCYVSMVNLSNVNTRRNAYYLRTLDPDNSEPDSGGSFSTFNKIEYQEPNVDNKVMVSATGLVGNTPVNSAFLGLGTKDCRAKCFIHYSRSATTSHTVLYPTYYTAAPGPYYYTVPTLDSMYGGDGGAGDTSDFVYALGYTIQQDIGISLVFKLGDIDPSDSVTFAYAYVLRRQDIDSAFLSTEPKWKPITAADSVPHTSGDSIEVCTGTDVEIKLINGSGFKWTWASPTGNKLKDTAGFINYVTIDSTTAIIYAIGHTPACGADTQIIILHPFSPPPPYVTNNGPLCIGDTLLLNAYGIPNSYFTWRGPNGFASTLPNPVKYNIQPADSGLFSVYDSIPGCPPQITSTNVLVDAVIAKIGTYKPDACLGADYPIYFAGRAPDTNTHYKWDFDNSTPLAPEISDTLKGPFVLNWDSIGTKTINLRVQNWRCVSTDTKPVPIIFAPPVHFDMLKDICVGQATGIVVPDYSLNGADSLMWNFDGGTKLSGGKGISGNVAVSYNSGGTKVVTLTIDYLLCTAAPYSDTITVHNSPQVHINAPGHDICQGDTLTFTADYNYMYRYFWSPTRLVDTAHSHSNYALFTVPLSMQVYLQVLDQYNCTSYDTLSLDPKVCCTVSFPSAFTPNGDGRNDVFKPIRIGHHHIYHFKILNRYGQVVYESNDENQGWDGTFNGVPQDIDTYFWFFFYDCNGKEIEEKGDVTLIR